MGHRRRLLVPAIGLCLLAADSAPALAQSSTPERVTHLARASTGQIDGRVIDEAGMPLGGVVISALGSATAFAVSDTDGQFSIRQLPPGPYLLRAHLPGYLSVRGTMVQVRSAANSPSRFTLHREGPATAPRHAEAVLGGTAVAAAADDDSAKGRDESEFAWRLRRLRRGVLRDADGTAVMPRDDDWFLTDSFELLGRAVETSARAASAFFGDLSLGGQVNLLTTGAFDSPADLLSLDRTRGVALFALGAPVGKHGDWVVRAAMNQGDLSSWILAGSYSVREKVPHRYQVGMSYSLQRYEGGNTAALAAVPDTARNVGTVFAFDDWAISRRFSVSYGGQYGHYDFLQQPSLVSPQMGATFAATPKLRIRTMAARTVSAPGAQEFLPPTRATWLPPQRTFAPISRDGFKAESLQHYEVGMERDISRATIGVRVFRQRISDQTVTLFGLRQPDSPAAVLGHYYVGSAGNADIGGWGLNLTHALLEHVRGTVDYTLASAQWTPGSSPTDRIRLASFVPAALRQGRERIHDITTTVEAELPPTATRVVLLYRASNGFAKSDEGRNLKGLDARFDLQMYQALPFMNFHNSHWEMLVAVRNVFHDPRAGASTYDELLVVRPPKRIVGGLTVKF